MKFLLSAVLLALSISTNSFGIIVSNICDAPSVGMTTDFACDLQGINTNFTDQRYNNRDNHENFLQ